MTTQAVSFRSSIVNIARLYNPAEITASMVSCSWLGRRHITGCTQSVSVESSSSFTAVMLGTMSGAERVQ